MEFLVYLLYFVASIFVVLSFFMLFAFYRTQRWGLFMMSMVYGSSGMLAAYERIWWPLALGFAGAWVLRYMGYDPDKELHKELDAAEARARRAGGSPPAPEKDQAK